MEPLKEGATSLNLGLVLQAVPDLRSFCTSVTGHNDKRKDIPGVKALRLVSKLCKEVMTGEVHGYSLQLRSQFILSLRSPGSEVQSIRAWRILSGVQLFRLAVQVHDEEFHPLTPGMLRTSVVVQCVVLL